MLKQKNIQIHHNKLNKLLSGTRPQTAMYPFELICCFQSQYLQSAAASLETFFFHKVSIEETLINTLKGAICQ